MEDVTKELKKKTNHKGKKAEKIWFSEAEFKTRQNLPESLPKRPSDIYLISADLIPEQYLRAIRLLRGQEEALWIHSLGSNIPVAVTFINKLKAELREDRLDIRSWCHTWEGLSDNWESRGQGPNSGLHFRVVLKEEEGGRTV